MRGKAEDRLMSENKKERINWREFLGIVSFTSNSLVDKLEEVFKENNDQLVDDHEIFYDVNRILNLTSVLEGRKTLKCEVYG